MSSRAANQMLGNSYSAWWQYVIFAGILFGLATTGVYAWASGNPMHFLGASLTVNAGAFALAGIAGFLFGIPLVNQAEASHGGAGQTDRAGTAYRVNTALEQISDWLTKIIVGLGLVELRQIGPYFLKVSTLLTTAYLPLAVSSSLVGASVAYFGTVGFVSGYLWSRIYLPVEFSRAEQSAKQSPAYFEGLMHAFLYQPSPDGFTSAIEVGQMYVKQFGDGTYRVWKYLACGYGQRFSYLKATSPGSTKEHDEAREKTLEALENVKRLDSRELWAMRTLWDGSGSEQENDLLVFKDDPDFKTLFESVKPNAGGMSGE